MNAIDNIIMYIKSPEILQNLIFTALGILILIFVHFSSGRLLKQFKAGSKKMVFYRKWVDNVFLILFILFMIRIWAVARLLDYFQNPDFDKIFQSVFSFGIIYILLYFARQFINSLKMDIQQRYQYRKRANMIAALIYFLYLIPVWAGSTKQWATMLSVMGAGVALALHEVLLNIAGWLYILIRHPYKTGDRVEMMGVRGDVIDIKVFQTVLLEIGNWVHADQSTGRVVHMPNGQVFKSPFFNYTKGFEFIWNEISILVTYESNWEKAREWLLQFGEEESREVQAVAKKKIDRMGREYLIYYQQVDPVVYARIEDSGVNLTLRYLTDVKMGRTGEDRITRKILRTVAQARDVDLAYPTYRIYQRGEKSE